jgi:hypothetical protein
MAVEFELSVTLGASIILIAEFALVLIEFMP